MDDSSTVKVKIVELDDLELLYAWRQDKEVMKFLPTASKSPTWEEHFSWWKRLQETNYSYYGMIVYEGRRVGVIHYRYGNCEIGLILGEKDVWGKGIGSKAIDIVCKRVKLYIRGYVQALILPENIASQRAFEKCAFVNTHETGRGGQEIWVKK